MPCKKTPIYDYDIFARREITHLKTNDYHKKSLK